MLKVSHYLEFHARDHDACCVRCLCDKESALAILHNVLKSREEERFFITLTNLAAAKEEEIRGFCKDGSCYYYTEFPEQPGNWRVHTAGVWDGMGTFVACRTERDARKLAMLFNITGMDGKREDLRVKVKEVLGY